MYWCQRLHSVINVVILLKVKKFSENFEPSALSLGLSSSKLPISTSTPEVMIRF